MCFSDAENSSFIKIPSNFSPNVSAVVLPSVTCRLPRMVPGAGYLGTMAPGTRYRYVIKNKSYHTYYTYTRYEQNTITKKQVDFERAAFLLLHAPCIGTRRPLVWLAWWHSCLPSFSVCTSTPAGVYVRTWYVRNFHVRTEYGVRVRVLQLCQVTEFTSFGIVIAVLVIHILRSI